MQHSTDAAQGKDNAIHCRLIPFVSASDSLELWKQQYLQQMQAERMSIQFHSTICIDQFYHESNCILLPSRSFFPERSITKYAEMDSTMQMQCQHSCQNQIELNRHEFTCEININSKLNTQNKSQQTTEELFGWVINETCNEKLKLTQFPSPVDYKLLSVRFLPSFDFSSLNTR